ARDLGIELRACEPVEPLHGAAGLVAPLTRGGAWIAADPLELGLQQAGHLDRRDRCWLTRNVLLGDWRRSGERCWALRRQGQRKFCPLRARQIGVEAARMSRKEIVPGLDRADALGQFVIGARLSARVG